MDQASKLGVSETKELIKLVATTAGVIKDASADGKIDLQDLPLLFKIVPVVSPALEGLKVIPKELADLDPAEAAEIGAYIATELMVSHEKAKEIINKSFAFIAALIELVKAVKA